MVRRKKDFLESNDPLETSHNREVWDKRRGMVPPRVVRNGEAMEGYWKWMGSLQKYKILERWMLL